MEFVLDFLEWIVLSLKIKKGEVYFKVCLIFIFGDYLEIIYIWKYFGKLKLDYMNKMYFFYWEM